MRWLFLQLLSCFGISSIAQNIGIGTTAPHNSAVLEVQSNNKGMLVPRVSLTATNVASPVTSPADALLVYNTVTSGSGSNAVSPGFYYWSATTNKWVALAAANNNAGSGIENAGYGTWDDCATAANISGYNPVAAANGLAGDEFGSSISISGNWAIIGAPKRDVAGKIDQGAAYLFFFNGTSWIEHSMITAGADGGPYDYFGASVSISGNYAVVGAYGDDDGTTYDVGSAFTYFYNGTAWVIQEKLTAPSAAAYDQFGISVFVSGSRLLIGAHQVDINGVVDQGAVYPYYMGNIGWVAQNRITGGDAGCRLFGRSLAVSGNRLVVGAAHTTIVGSAYFFALVAVSLNGPLVWIEQQKVMASVGGNTSFAKSVSIDGNTAAITSPISSDGAIYVYVLSNGSWIEQQRIPGGSYLGIAVAGNKLLGGRPGGAPTDIFVSISGLWEGFQPVFPPNGASPYFGFTVAMEGKRFAIGDYAKLSNRGMVYFGKIN